MGILLATAFTFFFAFFIVNDTVPEKSLQFELTVASIFAAMFFLSMLGRDNNKISKKDTIMIIVISGPGILFSTFNIYYRLSENYKYRENPSLSPNSKYEIVIRQTRTEFVDLYVYDQSGNLQHYEPTNLGRYEHTSWKWDSHGRFWIAASLWNKEYLYLECIDGKWLCKSWTPPKKGTKKNFDNFSAGKLVSLNRRKYPFKNFGAQLIFL